MFIFVPICLSLICGYAAVIVLQALGMLLVTRLGPRYLMTDDRLSGTYFFLQSAVWFLSAMGGASITYSLAPFAPYGPHVFCAVLAATFAAIVFRNDREHPSQQPISMTLTLYVVLAAGFFAGDLINTRT